MTKTLFATAAAMMIMATASFASVPALDDIGVKAKSAVSDTFDEAKRRKPRVPGGSGCNSPRDVAEHPECRRTGDAKDFLKIMTEDGEQQEARRRPRVPGGSGCDTPKDVAEHPECRVG